MTLAAPSPDTGKRAACLMVPAKEGSTVGRTIITTQKVTKPRTSSTHVKVRCTNTDQANSARRLKPVMV